MYNIFLSLILIPFISTRECTRYNDIRETNACRVDQFSEGFYKTAFVYFTKIFNKSYETQEEQGYRFGIFKKNYKNILVHNLNPEKTYELKLNKFSDLTEEEFEEKFLANYSNSNQEE